MRRWNVAAIRCIPANNHLPVVKSRSSKAHANVNIREDVFVQRHYTLQSKRNKPGQALPRAPR
uniref:Kinesin motor domain-containing protein n=1 Tax=Macrostomum lignano TaxID=282301 RepID=A0A1I8FB48_9PLAT